MPELPQKKVGIVSCSGEELAEGTITRLAALKVLEKLRPSDTVTICLPLFLAGGEGDRAFAKFYPTIAVDGCEKRCAYRGTEMYSNQPAASIVVTELVDAQGLEKPEGKRQLNAAGLRVADVVAEQMAQQVDQLLGKGWSRREGSFTQDGAAHQEEVAPQNEVTATCSCGSGIPIQTLQINGQSVTLLALPLIFQNFRDAQKAPSEAVMAELMEMVKIYNAVDPAGEPAARQAIAEAYQIYWNNNEVKHG